MVGVDDVGLITVAWRFSEVVRYVNGVLPDGLVALKFRLNWLTTVWHVLPATLPPTTEPEQVPPELVITTTGGLPPPPLVTGTVRFCETCAPELLAATQV